ncbi:hypothetical protein [Piscirickettsia litoralis]|uniref:DNA-binding protein n=1 Tax=Piscirickettsia litoralis TaxID=1891921 RepID=A0ABX2ZX90_9GAMM|nr:hypothetical protein [Piscirickettsia litoralis]ODN41216.1 hypothetical protein BGC07_17535 [Piscirickettsia litoralis]
MSGLKKEERLKRIKFISENYDSLTLTGLAEMWGVKPFNVYRFIKRNNLPRVSTGGCYQGESRKRFKGKKENSPSFFIEERSKARINYVLKNKDSLSLEELAERWEIGIYGVSAFLFSNDLPVLPTRKADVKRRGVRVDDSDKLYMGKYRNINDFVAMARW